MQIGIINTKTSNIKSVINALNYLGYKKFKLITEFTDEKFTHLIMPGNGNYKSNMDIIYKNKLDKLIIKHYEDNKFFFGICVGMQILSTYGFETKKEKGLNIIEGDVIKIPTKSLRLPHIGWNELCITKKDIITKDINNMSSFYFLHSYYFDIKNKIDLIGTVLFDKDLPAIIKKNNFYGVQFHAEKSQYNGLKLIDKFLKLR
jgi:imidazole glycerol-phosphate synthase subunit HisH